MHDWPACNHRAHKKSGQILGEEIIAWIESECRGLIERYGIERWVETSPVGTERLADFWDWALEHCTDVTILAALGYWMKPDPLLFDNKWLAARILRTLEKTNGVIEWQHGVLAAPQELAPISPSTVMQCLQLQLVEARDADPAHSGWVYADDELIKTFRIL